MRVVEVSEFGEPEVLRVRTRADCVAGPGQVVVRVAYCGVLSLDTVIRSGRGGDMFAVRLPYVPGVGVAGEVAAVGAGVDSRWLGKRVLADVGGGGYAEQVVTSRANLIPIPDAVDLPTAMALLHDGSTALAVFEAMAVQAGESVLVQPAAGGLGNVLVQLAHAVGARVIGAARGPGKLRVVKELGADIVVDYSTPGWADEVGAVDVAFDGVGGELGRTAYRLVRAGGRFSAYGFAGGTPVAVDAVDSHGRRALGLDQLAGYAPGRGRRTRQILDMAADGAVRAVIGATYPLAEAAQAHRALRSRRVTGKVLLEAC